MHPSARVHPPLVGYASRNAAAEHAGAAKAQQGPDPPDVLGTHVFEKSMVHVWERDVRTAFCTACTLAPRPPTHRHTGTLARH